MKVGSLKVRLFVRQSRSLKDKRQVIRSIKDRLRNSFNAAVAEVEAEEDRQLSVLGIAMVSNEVGYLKANFEKILQALRTHPVAEFLDYEMETEEFVGH